MIIKEFCAENTTLLNQLDQSVKHVEPYDNLTVGDTAPFYGTIKEAVRYLHEKDIALATVIHPRDGNFIYNNGELRIMEDDTLYAVELESDSLVSGLLTEDNHIDQDGIEQLLPATQKLPLVSHMAFDHIPLEEQRGALDQLVELSFIRILAHGSAQNNGIFKNIAHLKSLVDYADDCTKIMVGGNVTTNNYQELVERASAQTVHGTEANYVLQTTTV